MKVHLFIVSLCVVTGLVQGRFLNFAQSIFDKIGKPWYTPPGCISCIQTAARTYFENLRSISPDCAGDEIQDFDDIENGGIFRKICKFPFSESYRNTYKVLTIYGAEVLDYFVECFKEDYTDGRKAELQKYNKAFDDSRKMCGEPNFLEDRYQYFVSLASDEPPRPKRIQSTKGFSTTGQPSTTPMDLPIPKTYNLPSPDTPNVNPNDSLEIASIVKPIEAQAPDIFSPVTDEISENMAQALPDNGSEQQELKLPSSTSDNNPDTTSDNSSGIAFNPAMVEPQPTTMLSPGPNEISADDISTPSKDSEQQDLELIATTLDDVSNSNDSSLETSDPETMETSKLESESPTQPDLTTSMSQEIPNSTSSEPLQVSSIPEVTILPSDNMFETVSNNAIGQESQEPESTEAVAIYEESPSINEPILIDLPKDSSNDSVDSTFNEIAPEPPLPLKDQPDHELTIPTQSDILNEKSVSISSNEFPQDQAESESNSSTTLQESRSDLPLSGTLPEGQSTLFQENQTEPELAHPLPVDQLDPTLFNKTTTDEPSPELKTELQDSSEAQPTLTAPEPKTKSTLGDVSSSGQPLLESNITLDQNEPHPITPPTLEDHPDPTLIDVSTPMQPFSDPNTSLEDQNDPESIIPAPEDLTSSALSDASPSVEPISRSDVTLKDQTEPELSDSILLTH